MVYQKLAPHPLFGETALLRRPHVVPWSVHDVVCRSVVEAPDDPLCGSPARIRRSTILRTLIPHEKKKILLLDVLALAILQVSMCEGRKQITAPFMSVSPGSSRRHDRARRDGRR